jgi:hypothetical protein
MSSLRNDKILAMFSPRVTIVIVFVNVNFFIVAADVSMVRDPEVKSLVGRKNELEIHSHFPWTSKIVLIYYHMSGFRWLSMNFGCVARPSEGSLEAAGFR